jgi:hypothetical protein
MSKNRERVIVGLSIAWILAIVNPACVAASGDAKTDALSFCGKKPTQSCKDFAELLTRLMRAGDIRPHVYADKRADVLKLPAKGAFSKADGVPDDESPDHVQRICDLMYDKDPSLPDAKPVCVVMYMGLGYSGDVGKESYLRFNLDGKADMAVDSEGKFVKDGEKISFVKGSATYQKLSLKKAEVKARIEHELSFWINRAKEMSAKEAAGASAPKAAEPVDAAQSAKDAPADPAQK